MRAKQSQTKRKESVGAPFLEKKQKPVALGRLENIELITGKRVMKNE